MKYPKTLLVVLTFIVAGLFLHQITLFPYQPVLASFGYWGIFLIGIFYTYGFTSAFATVALAMMAPGLNIWIAGLIAGSGALLGDLTIFRLIRFTLDDELKLMKRESFAKKLAKFIPQPARFWVFTILGALIISSPFPDEIGVMMLASQKRISTRIFSVISYALNTGGILVILYLAQ